LWYGSSSNGPLGMMDHAVWVVPAQGRDDKVVYQHIHKRSCAFSRRDAPELWFEFCPSRSRGRRESRVRAAPAVSCAKMCEKTHTSIQVQRRQSGLPCAMVLRLMPRSPRRRIRFVTVIDGLRFAVPGWVRKTSADLTSATDARTTRFCRTR